MNRRVHNRKQLKENRKALRNNGTGAEAFLWQLIKGSSLDGNKFRRQHSVGNYILDFYCPSQRLAVELDGAGHFTAAGFENDEERTKYLIALKIKVIRFENRLVFEQPDFVIAEIRRHFK